jgi:putative ABC transport system permease protein
VFYVKADRPSNIDAIVQEIKAIPHMETYNVYSMREWLSMMTADNVPMLSKFIRIMIGIAVTIGVIVIFQAMYGAVMERTREIGILKSLGASKVYILNIILRETTLLAIGGIIVGIAISFAASFAIRRQTTLPVRITPQWLVYAIVIAIVGALAGALYPALKAAQKDPVDALAYE